jgi:putative ATP-binding cassette transporter
MEGLARQSGGGRGRGRRIRFGEASGRGSGPGAMADQSVRASAPLAGASVAGEGLWPQLMMMVGAFIASAQRTTLLMLAGVTVAVVAATAYAQIRLNAWNKPFYDALATKDFEKFLRQLLVFAVIAGALLCLNVAQTWLNQMLKLKLREGLARDLLDQWLAPGRAVRLAGIAEIGVNPDQRMHEDARHLTELSTDLGIGLLQASLLLVSFIGVLWVISDRVVFTFGGARHTIPGYMVWCALAYASAGSWLSWRVGRPLIPLNAERYAREADLRFSLVRVNEQADSIALEGGEVDEKRHLDGDVAGVMAVLRRLVTGLTRLTWITACYGWLALVAPILVASPGFFGGDMTLGGLMVAAGAFTQVQQSLRWFVDNFNVIADWLATLRRVASFRRALIDLDQISVGSGGITRARGDTEKFAFDNLAVRTPNGLEALDEAHVEVAAGEHLLISGARGSNLTTLFRAVAGLWRLGAGRIGVPASQDVMFMPQRPYAPPGALRDALAYPSPPTAFADADMIAACGRVGLPDVGRDLDRRANWAATLSSEEAQRLAFARLLLHKPRWVCIDDALNSLDVADRQQILALFRAELAGAGVISFGYHDLGEGFSSRIVHLIKSPETPA